MLQGRRVYIELMDPVKVPTGKLEQMFDLSVSPDLAKRPGIDLAAHFSEIE